MKSTSEPREVTLAEAAELSGYEEEGIPTHKVSFYGLRCYFNTEYGTVWMRWQLFDFLIPAVAHIHNALCLFTSFLIPNFKSPGFPLKILDEYRMVYREGTVDIESRRKCESYDQDEDKATS